METRFATAGAEMPRVPKTAGVSAYGPRWYSAARTVGRVPLQDLRVVRVSTSDETAASLTLNGHGPTTNLRTTFRARIVISICFFATSGVEETASADWDRSIRLRHAFDTIPDLAAALLCVQERKTGYALGVTGGAFWLWMARMTCLFDLKNRQRHASAILYSRTAQNT